MRGCSKKLGLLLFSALMMMMMVRGSKRLKVHTGVGKRFLLFVSFCFVLLLEGG